MIGLNANGMEILTHLAAGGVAQSAVLRLATRPVEDHHRLLSAHCQIGVPEADLLRPRIYTYPNLVLSEHWIPVAAALDILSCWFQGHQAEVPRLGWIESSPLTSHARHLWSGASSAFVFAEWPTVYLECDGKRTPEEEKLLHDPDRVVGAQGPLFPSARSAVLSFVHGRHGYHDTGLTVPNLIAFGCDRRARIVRLGIEGNRLSIIVEHEQGLGCLAKLFGTNVPEDAREGVPIQDGHVTLQLDDKPSYLLIGLVSDQGELLDEREINFQWGSVPRDLVVTPETRELVVEDWIKGGENHRIEYKRALTWKDERSKNEFMESVVAFYNSEGGTIILGVSDNGEVIGFHRPDLRDTLIGMLRDRCDPVPRVDVEDVKLSGHPLTLIHVAKRKDADLCSLDRVKFYIRAGSTDRLARGEELANMFRVNRGR